MASIGKLLLTFGTMLVIVGAGLLLADRLGFRGLPGDIVWKGKGITIYAPIVTSLVVSVVLSLIFSLLRK
jgi:hypothetical protein